MMIKKFLISAAIMAAGLALAVSSHAVPIFNIDDDLGHETFYLDDLAGVSTNSLFEIKLEEAGYYNDNSFGIYRSNVGSAGVNSLGLDQHWLRLFDGSDGLHEIAKLSWDLGTGDLSLSKSSDGLVFNQVLLGALDLDYTEFGFYLNNGHGDTFFSETHLNADGQDHMLALAAGATDSFVLAWEDVSFGDQDFNDFVLLADDILPAQAVPEPTGLALMFGGLGMLGLVRRR